MKTTVDRIPVRLAHIPLPASRTEYYPSSGGQDRLGSEHLAEYVRAIAWADQAGTLTLEESDNGSSWSTTGSALTVPASDLAVFPWTQLTKRYWRWKYVNGGTAQTNFRLFEEKTPDLQRVESSSRRSDGVLHRSNISATDKVAAPGTLTLSGQTITGGTLNPATTYYVQVAAVSLQDGSGHIIGVTTLATEASAAPGGANNALRVAFAAVTNADAYLIFLSADSGAAKLVAYITAAEHAAGGEITEVFGSVAAGGAANSIDIGVAGTGIGADSTIFDVNTAHLPHVVASAGSVNTKGYAKAVLYIRVRMSKSAVWSAAPALTLIPWVKSKESSADWAALSASALTLMASATDSLTQVVEVSVGGADALVTTLDTITGCAVDVWVELTTSEMGGLAYS